MGRDKAGLSMGVEVCVWEGQGDEGGGLGLSESLGKFLPTSLFLLGRALLTPWFLFVTVPL